MNPGWHHVAESLLASDEHAGAGLVCQLLFALTAA
jgi:hypothetical protein